MHSKLHRPVFSFKCVWVCVTVVMNPWPTVCPLNPRWPWKQEFQLTHHRSVFFSSRFALLSLLSKCRRGLTATSPLPPLFSCPLSSPPFSCSSVWAPLFYLLFCLIELFGRRACQTAPSMWGVRGAGGHPPLCSQRRVSFSLLFLHEWTWPRLGPEGAAIKLMKYCEGF